MICCTLELVWIFNALMSSLKVLGNDMPNAEEARHFESRVSKTLDEACSALKRLRLRNGELLVRDMADHVFKITEITRGLE
jgi:uncharacterized protein YicC (UPF0701 family)